MADLTFTIKTPAELSGAQQAAEALETGIGKAKALGQEYGQIEQRLTAIKAAIDAYDAAQKQAGAGAKEGMDETERYQAKLAEMFDREHQAKVQSWEDAQKTKQSLQDQEQDVGDVSEALDLLLERFGAVGRLAKVSGNGAGLALEALAVGVGIATRAVTDLLDRYRELNAELAQVNEDRFSILRTRVSEAQTALEDFNAVLADPVARDAIAEAATQREAIFNAEHERITALIHAQEGLAVARLQATNPAGNNQGAEAELRARFSALRNNQARNADAEELGRLKEELRQRQTDQARLEQDARTARQANQENTTSLSRIDAETELQRLLRERAKLVQKAADTGDAQRLADASRGDVGTVVFGSEMDFGSAMAAGASAMSAAAAKAAADALQKNADAIAVAQRQLDDFTNTETQRKTAEADAVSRFQSNNSRIIELGNRITTLEKVNPIRERSRSESHVLAAATRATNQGQGAAAGLVLNAAAGADALQAGERATAEQAHAIAQLVQRFNLRGQSNAAIIGMLSRLNDSDETLLRAIRDLNARMNDRRL